VNGTRPLTKGSHALAGLIGTGIQKSLTPALHMREGTEQGFQYHYELLDLDHIQGGAAALATTLQSAEERGFVGVNITHPCKQLVLPLLDELSEDAAALGAVNTVVFDHGRRLGHNTDWWGFAESFRRGLRDVAMDAAVQLGAGGAGAAVAYAMLKLGVASLEIFDIDRARMHALVAKMSQLFPKQRIVAATSLVDAMRTAAGLVNATTMGMVKSPGLPLPAELLEPRHWVAEIVYFPLQTELLRRAQARGCRTLDGGGMAIYQAVHAFRLFTGITPDPQRMTRHFDRMARVPLTSDASALIT
jgi:shikimate dehydrogenase